MSTCVTHHYCDCTAERIKQLVAECDRLLSANDTLVSRIEDLSQGYALEDTCPRVQCRTTSRRLKNQAYEYQRALERIANTNRDPRPDGTYNISRDALIDWAQRALHATEGDHE